MKNSDDFDFSDLKDLKDLFFNQMPNFEYVQENYIKKESLGFKPFERDLSTFQDFD